MPYIHPKRVTGTSLESGYIELARTNHMHGDPDQKVYHTQQKAADVATKATGTKNPALITWPIGAP